MGLTGQRPVIPIFPQRLGVRGFEVRQITIYLRKETYMQNQFSRTELLLGTNGMKRLSGARVAVFGIGGVGGHAAEALVRSGIGEIDLIDNDTVAVSNLNRQIFALTSTIGEYKVDAAKKRLLDINPDLKINTFRLFFTPETSSEIDFSKYDYVIDAIDTVSGKIEIIMKADEAKIPVISSMGAGNKLDATAFEVTDIYKTSVCPLARVMRRELKSRGIKKLKVVYSKEPALTPSEDVVISEEEKGVRRQVPGSNAFVPSVVGLIIAGEVIKDIALG